MFDIVGPWVIASIYLYRDSRTGTQYIGIWASRVLVCWEFEAATARGCFTVFDLRLDHKGYLRPKRPSVLGPYGISLDMKS